MSSQQSDDLKRLAEARADDTATTHDDELAKAFLAWIDEGRDTEHVYGVTNFLSSKHFNKYVKARDLAARIQTLGSLPHSGLVTIDGLRASVVKTSVIAEEIQALKSQQQENEA